MSPHTTQTTLLDLPAEIRQRNISVGDNTVSLFQEGPREHLDKWKVQKPRLPHRTAMSLTTVTKAIKADMYPVFVQQLHYLNHLHKACNRLSKMMTVCRQRIEYLIDTDDAPMDLEKITGLEIQCDDLREALTLCTLDIMDLIWLHEAVGERRSGALWNPKWFYEVKLADLY